MISELINVCVCVCVSECAVSGRRLLLFKETINAQIMFTRYLFRSSAYRRNGSITVKHLIILNGQCTKNVYMYEQDFFPNRNRLQPAWRDCRY